MANGVYNALNGHRTMQPVQPTSRQRCHCGCGKRATHMKMVDGCCMGTGCELDARRWVRNPVDSWRASSRLESLSTDTGGR